MKMGQFCGLIADEMNLIHADFVDAATILFEQMDEEEGEHLSISYGVPLPDRCPNIQDAALLMFLVAATDIIDEGEAEALVRYARVLGTVGENLPTMLEALKAGEDVEVELPGRLAGSVLIPRPLMQAVARVINSSKPAKIRSI
ncbi:hypothetical protein [Rhizobium sp.]|uniref:hypothetical protein n=1 Tax=Rhizobium sp. TaxID=391 RepID=UPI003F809B5B